MDMATCRGIPDGSAEAVTLGSTYPYSWDWRDVGAGENIRYELLNGPYFVKATDVNGCIDSARYVLHYEKKDLTYLPSAFSSNGDGTNDYFFPMGSACILEVNYFAIFDRWGAYLYEKRAFQPGDLLAGWDGTYEQRVMNPGTYIWKAMITYHSAVVEEKSGDVTLCR
jgi:gliding motility-associated-like protein